MHNTILFSGWPLAWLCILYYARSISWRHIVMDMVLCHWASISRCFKGF